MKSISYSFIFIAIQCFMLFYHIKMAKNEHWNFPCDKLSKVKDNIYYVYSKLWWVFSSERCSVGRRLERVWKYLLWPCSSNTNPANKMWSHLTMLKLKLKLSFFLSAPFRLLLLAVETVPCMSALWERLSLSDSDGVSDHRETRPAATCGRSQSPKGSQPWSRRVAVFCSPRNQTWSRGAAIVLRGTWLHACTHLLPMFWFSLSLWRHRSGLHAPSEPVFGHTSGFWSLLISRELNAGLLP